MSTQDAWPELRYETWQETAETLHLWTQIIGKIRLAQSPWINHGWQVPLYVTARGLTTSTIPHGQRAFQIDFDFVDHRLVVASSDGMVMDQSRTRAGIATSRTSPEWSSTRYAPASGRDATTSASSVPTPRSGSGRT